jgi:hypothetical protein
MGFFFNHALVVTGVAKVAEVPEGVALMPTGSVAVHGVLSLYLVAVLTGRSLGTTLGICLRCWPEKNQSRQAEGAQQDQQEIRKLG